MKVNSAGKKVKKLFLLYALWQIIYVTNAVKKIDIVFPLGIQLAEKSQKNNLWIFI